MADGGALVGALMATLCHSTGSSCSTTTATPTTTLHRRLLLLGGSSCEATKPDHFLGVRSVAERKSNDT